ncbi:MAG: 5-(carboxyamino)imidazole ribonucleotide mutase [Bdellovibrionales bacterium]|nr:5-(carboxyamino)imidazole ribonucleotide mutase [Bdellovibrionales bacterium]
MKNKKLVSIIMGSNSDLPCMKKSAEVLEQAKVPFEIKVVSAHRTPKEMQKYALSAKKRGIKVIIAGAGGAAHLPGMVASLTSLPVIGVPIKTKSLDGLDSLLSIAQMPEGVPVASMAIHGSTNAGLMALRILALSSSSIVKKVEEFQKKQKQKVTKANKKLISQ